MYRALFETMEAYPGLVHGAFFWDTWIAVNEGHWESPSVHRAYSFRGKLSEPTVREWYDRFWDDRVASVVDRWDLGMTPGGGNCDGTPFRVPTTFVLKYTLTAQPEPSDGHEAVEGGAGDAGDLGDGGLGHAQLEEVTDFILLAVES